MFEMPLSKLVVKVSFAIALMLVNCLPLSAQTEPESASNVLVFTQTKAKAPKSDTVLLSSHVEMLVKHKVFAKRGNLEAILDGAIVVKGREYHVTDIKSIAIVNPRLSKIGLIFLYVSLVVLAAALWLPILAANYLANHPLVPRTGKVDLLYKIGFRLGMALLFIGDLIMVFRGKSYNLRRKWKLSVQKGNVSPKQ